MTRRLSARAGAPGARILGFGDYRPRRIVTNEEISQRVDTDDEWIRTRVGIAERRFAGDDESVVDMSVAAAGKALATSGVLAQDIDTVIVATCTPPAPIPGLAPEVAHRLGIASAGAFDLNAACAGFCYGLASAADAIRSGSSQNALVIGAEKLTDWTDQDDRGTCIIFGDGAGAAVVTATDSPGIGPVVWGSDGEKSRAISVADRSSFMEMDGRAVYRWATTQLADSAHRACKLAGVDISDIDVFVPHQANLRIVDSMVRTLKLRDDVAVARDIVTSGNTSSASIPLALTAMIERGEVKTGDTALLLGFGAGLTFAGQVIICP
ncbi:MAG: ketoacyl-ACP synthase III [Geodermatophilaceae bacterium]|jgi:3-oxoacyl-[acyl-carrier-protein] synthase-3|nr:ketoacyl-ACP synthase III [Geodermatophilaceae bacterium]